MPIFENNGKKQRVQDTHVEKYMELYPDATTIMERGGKKYRVKAKDYNTFLGDTLKAPQMESAPQNVTAPQVETEPQQGGEKAAPKAADINSTSDKRGYTFTAQELERMEKPQEQVVEAATDKIAEIPVIRPEYMSFDEYAKGLDERLGSIRKGQGGVVDAARVTMEGAFDRAYAATKGMYYADKAEKLTKGLLDEYSAERAKRLSQVEEDVENFNSARKWAANPYTYGTDAYSEVAYRSGATKLRKADELGMMEEFAEDAKKRLLADENLKVQAEKNAEMLGMSVDKYIDEVAVPILQNRMYGEWLAPREERMKRDYNGLAAAIEGSLIGTLFGSTRTDTEKYLSQVGQEAWRERSSLLGRAAAGAGSMLFDLPAFGGLGALASVPTKYVGAQAFKQLAKNETKRLVARGVAEGAAQRYANYAVRNGLKNRILLNLATAPLQSGLTFGMFDAGKAALNMSLNGKWDWGELGKSAAGGALMGGALGVTSAVGSGLTYGLTGATKAASKVAEFGVENAVFTEGGRLIGKLHGEQPQNGWWEDYVESGATLLMIKAPNIVKNISRIKGNKEASEVFAFNNLEREQLGKYGKDLNAVLEGMLPRGEKMTVEGEGVSLDGVNEGLLAEEYVRVMLDPEIAMTTKAKLAAIVEGKAMPTPRVVDVKIEGNRVMTYDPMGRLVEVKEYASEAKADAEYKKVANAAEVESIAVMEDIYVRIKGYEADEATVKEWLAKNPDVTAENVASIVAKENAGEPLTKSEQNILNSLREARREGLNDLRHLNDVLVELDVDPRDVMSGIKKPINERTEKENRAVRAYTDILYQEIKAKVKLKSPEDAASTEDAGTAAMSRLIESDRSVDETANNGMIYTTTTHDGEKVIITGGKVVLDNEGYIDPNQSEGLVAQFPDGRKPVRANDLRNKVEVSNAEETKAAKREEIKQEIATENGWKPLEIGAEYDVVFDGEQFRVKVEGRDERGDVIISSEGESLAVSEGLLQDAMKQAEGLKGESGEVVAQAESGNVMAESGMPAAATGDNVAPVVQAENGNAKGDSENAASVVDKKARRAELEAIIPVEDKKKQFTKVEPAVTAEYIQLLTDDVAKQVATADKYIANIRAAQEKADPIEALEMDEQIAYWESVKSLLAPQESVSEVAEASPVVEETQAPVVESAPVETIETSRATNEMQPVSEEGVHPTIAAADEGRDTVGGSPVALAYLLEGGEGSILNAGYFLHGVAAAFPAVSSEIEALRGAMSGDVLGMNPTEFVAQRAEEIAQIGELITNAYGDAGAVIYNELLNNASGFVPRVGAEVSARIEALQPLNESTLSQTSDQVGEQVAENGGENSTLEQIKAELGPLNRDNAAEYARRLFAVSPWKTLEEANTVLKELLASYGETLSGQTLGVVPFLDEARNLIIDDDIAELKEQNRVADERQQRIGLPPRVSDYSKAITEGDAEVMKEWEGRFNDYMSKLLPVDIPALDSTIRNMQGNKDAIKTGDPKGYKENPNYKAFDYIEKALKKRKKEIEESVKSEIEERLKNNFAAIETVKQLLESGEEPNDAQREIVSKFDGWAGLEDWHDEIVLRLKDILSDANEYTVEALGNEHAFDGLEGTLQKLADNETNTTQAELQQGTLFLDEGSEALERATEETMNALAKTGVEVVIATEEQVNDMLELAEMQKRKSPETALPEDESSFKGTVISSDDGAKILKDLDNAIAEYENKGNSAKTFIGDVARILRAVRHGSKSEYADIVTANGIPVRIRLADHNVKVLNYDNAGINNGISIVISRKPNEGITNNGDAHLVEFFYSDKKISKADGKPLVEILKSIKQALYSGEYKDNTGLAVREEVNIPEMMTVFHGSGAKFDKFDHSYMGTGEGAQAFGWGTYVTEVEGIGRTYATTMRDKAISDKHRENAIINNLARQVLASNNGDKNAALEELRNLLNESWSDKKRVKAEIKIIETGKFLPETKVKANLYSVEIPDDNGSNYLHWDKPINGEIQERIANGLQSIGFEIEPEMNYLAYSRDGKIAVLNINAKGKDLYVELSDALGGDKAASEFLNDMGFVGISYPAEAMSGGRKDGARNYVIFNENDAQITDRVQFLRTSNGTVYGWAVDGKIYLTPDGINPNTPVHEYTHLWASAVEQRNPKLWAEIVGAMKLSPVWAEVAADEAYRDIWNDDNRMASEVLSRLSGAENYRRTMEQAEKEIASERDIVEKVRKKGIWNRIKNALKNFWNWVQRNVFGNGKVKTESEKQVESEAMPWEDFANSVISDFYKGRNPNAKESPLEKMFIGERGARNLDRIEEENGDFNFTPRRGVSSKEREEKMNARTEELAEALNERGFDTTISKSRTSFGMSNYIIVRSKSGEVLKKIRLSDHSVTNNGRVLNEYYTMSTDTVEGIVADLMGEKEREIGNRISNLINAKSMERRGKDAKAIKLATGWERGADGKWRYETEDAKVNREAQLFSLNDNKRYPVTGFIEKGRVDIDGTVRLDKLIDDEALFDAYPELREYYVTFEEMETGTVGSQNYNDKVIRFNRRYSIDKLNSTLNHEIQHAIQHIEGFAIGSVPENFRNIDFYDVPSESIHDMYNIRKAADELIEDGKYKYLRSAIKKVFEEYRLRGWLSPKTFEAFELNVEGEDWGVDSFVSTTMSYSADELNEYSINEDWRNMDMYRRTAGEVESRNVQERMGMTPEERRNSLAEETADVAKEDQIFLFENLGVSASDEAKKESAEKFAVKNNANFVSTYKTKDGKDIEYTSERAEGYGIQGGGTGNSYDGTGNSILQRQTDTGVPGANSGLNEDKGEFCVVERVFTENGAFNFTSGEKIESADDVAYIFSALEDAAKEHSFVVYVKDGKPTVIELGMGSFNATMLDIPTASLAYSRINPDHVYFVHNHPSGNLVCSGEDVAMLRVFEDMSDVPVTGVIINLKTGKYGTFDTERHSVIGEKRVPENEERLTVHTLDKQIFASDYDPMAQPLVRSSQDVAQFLNSQRMGDRPKVSFLILSRANRIIGNIHTPFTDITTDTEAVARYINERVIQFGGENAILYGDFAISMDESRGFRLLQGAMERFGKTKLLDVVHVEGNFTKSAIDLGLLYEPEMEYNVAKENEERYNSPEQDIPVESVQTQPLTFKERITNSVLAVSAKNKEDLALRSDALRMFGRDVANVLKLMGKQREYDKSTVDQLLKLVKMYFKDAQLLEGLTSYQVGRVMSGLKNAVGKKDITDDANNLVNVLVDAHNKELDNILEKAAKTKAKKVNASGVEVIGKLDKEGQLLLEEYNNGKMLDLERIDEKILELRNEAAEGKSEDAAARLRGLELARQYREEILKKRDEIKGLEQELKKAKQDRADGLMSREAYTEFRRSTERAIVESKLEMVDAYHGLIHGLGGDISGSARRAKLFQQAQIDHVKEIQHNANSDLQGHPAEAQGETPDRWNGSVPRLFMSAMPTFQTMLKFFGEKAADGRGYLYERFIPQHTQASHNEYIGKMEAREKMRKKLTEIFGKKTTIEKFMDMSRKDGAVLEYQEGGEKKTIELTRGQVLYLYMINKMADGQMKLSRMGITDAVVMKMANELPQGFKEFADWVQEELLTELREKYNKVHERMFGAPMAAIESYFPIKINKRSRGEKIEPGMNAEDKPSTITGSVIKRTKNAVAIDLSADAMQVLLGHIDDMENWAAWAEFRRDVRSLLNYRHFQNQVKGMESIRFGSGEKLWKNFVDVANIAAGSFKPSSSAIDKAVRNIAKGVVSSKISFRYFTAVKQILSTPAFWSEVDFDKMVHAYTHQREAWKWAKENLPGFTKRWEGRAAGNEILLESDKDWKVWKNRFVEGVSKEGMRANAAIDALTVAVGAKAVYETKYEMFKKAGYSEERAREKALNRAAEAYNESQQSSESAYLSPLQAEATFVSSVLTAYRNSPFGYNRKLATAIANLKKKMKKGFKQESIEYMTKQLMRDGLNEEQAKRFAKSTYRRSVARDAADVAQFGFLLSFVWALGGGAKYLFGGDDEEEKKEILLEAALDGATSGIAQLPAGETLTGAIKAIAEGDVSNFKLPQAVAMQDMETIADLMQTDPVRAAGELLNILVAMGVRVNPQTFTDMFVALADVEDWSDPREIAMFVLRFNNAPNSKLELLEADEAMENYGANIEEITREYAEYQKKKRAPLTGWLYSDEKERKAIERYEKRFKKILDERFETIVENTDEYDAWYENSNPQMKAKLAKLRKAYLEGDKETTMEKLDSLDITKKVLYGSGYDEVNTVYYELSTAEDEDMAMMIDQKIEELTPMMDEYKKLTGDDKKAYREKNLEVIQLYNKLNNYKNDVNTQKGIMKKKPEKAQKKMEIIRKKRTKAVELINNYRNE